MTVLTFPWVLIFAFGGLWWWLLILAAVALVYLCLDWQDFEGQGFREDESYYGRASFVVLATILAMELFGNLGFVASIREHTFPLWPILYGVGSFIVGGSIFAGLKWLILVFKRKHKYQDLLADFMDDNGLKGKIADASPEMREKWAKVLLSDPRFSKLPTRWSSSSERKIYVKPLFKDYKGRFLGWMMFWPWVLLYDVFCDFLKHTLIFIRDMMSGLMNSIANTVFRGVENDFTVVKEESKNV